MVTNFPHSMLSDRGIRTATDEVQPNGFGTRVFGRLRHLYCGLHGHDSLLQFKHDRMFLKCVSCGHETPGWSLTETPPPVTIRGDGRRQILARPQLISARRIA